MFALRLANNTVNFKNLETYSNTNDGREIENYKNVRWNVIKCPMPKSNFLKDNGC